MDCERLRECSRGSAASASMGTIPSEISKQLELKVLIVDDESGMRKVTRALL
jgi:hypothetical protein